jgi:AmiR/NasT family two-component response regulator
MSLGAAAYLIKPFDPTTIIPQINEALAKVQAPQIG